MKESGTIVTNVSIRPHAETVYGNIRKENMKANYFTVMNVNFNVNINRVYIFTRYQGMKGDDIGVICVSSHPWQKSGTEKHFQSKHEGITYTCKQCSYTDNVQSNVIRHKQYNHEGLLFECDRCNYNVRCKDNLRDHKKAVHEGILSRCDQCKFTSPWKAGLIRHKRIHTGTTIDLPECQFCCIMFKNTQAFKIHMAKTHKGKKKLADKVKEECLTQPTDQQV